MSLCLLRRWKQPAYRASRALSASSTTTLWLKPIRPVCRSDCPDLMTSLLLFPVIQRLHPHVDLISVDGLKPCHHCVQEDVWDAMWCKSLTVVSECFTFGTRVYGCKTRSIAHSTWMWFSNTKLINLCANLLLANFENLNLQLNWV